MSKPAIQILNLTSQSRKKRLWDIGFIELTETDRNMVQSIVNKRAGESCFTLPYLRLIREIIQDYDTEAVYIEDEMNKEGVVELIVGDLKKIVVLQSEVGREIVKITPKVYG